MADQELTADELEEVARAAVMADAARKLLILDMLGDRVVEAQQALRAELAKGGRIKESFPETVPNDEDPEKPFLAGKVRIDGGNVTVRVADEAAFRGYVKSHYPAKLIEQPEGSTARPAPDAGEAEALLSVLDEARQLDTWAERPELALWAVLQEAGYQLAKIEKTPARAVVDPEYWGKLEKHLKLLAAEYDIVGDVEAADTDGIPIPGLKVTRGARKAVVIPSKDRAIVDAFVRNNRGSALLALGQPEE